MTAQLSFDLTAIAPEEYKAQVRRAIECYPFGIEFQVCEAIHLAGIPEPDGYAKYNGAVTSALAAEGLIEFLRYEKSRRETTRKSACGVWRRVRFVTAAAS